MTGVGNKGFEDGEVASQTKLEDNFELKEQPNSDVSIGVEGSNPKEKHPQTKENFVVRWNLKIRAILKKLLWGKSQLMRVFRIVLINGAAAAFLAASFTRSQDFSDVDWCSGVGFLWILYVLVYVGVIYYGVKKFFGKSISAFLEPLFRCFASAGANKYFQMICYSAPIVALAVFVIISPGKSGRRIFSFVGMIVFIVLGYLFSKHPAHVRWRPVLWGVFLQFGFGLLAIQWETGRNILDCLGNKVTTFLHYSEKGASFVFGSLATPGKNEAPIFAFTVLPVIYFLAFFVNILSYLGILQWFIMKASWLVKSVMGTTVCESVNATASIFLGQTETLLLIQNYVKYLTKSEICAILCAGWSTVAGTVMAAYIQFGVSASHLVAASIMSAPASLSYSKLVYPETVKSKNTLDNIVLEREEGANVLDAASKGAMNAVGVIASITANIIAFLAFVAFLDGTLGWIGSVVGFDGLSFQFLMSKLFYPISFLIGVDEESLEDIAYLIGIKTVANEFQAYEKLGEYIRANKLSLRSEIIATYALCGFSNFGSIGIAVGTLCALEPSRRGVITEVAFPAFIAANIVCFLTACVAGCLID